jgi:hypothetical protein
MVTLLSGGVSSHRALPCRPLIPNGDSSAWMKSQFGRYFMPRPLNMRDLKQLHATSRPDRSCVAISSLIGEIVSMTIDAESCIS